MSKNGFKKYFLALPPSNFVFMFMFMLSRSNHKNCFQNAKIAIAKVTQHAISAF